MTDEPWTPQSTPRLRFRPLTMDDVDALAELDSDPEVMRHLTGGAPTPRADVEASIRRKIAELHRDGLGRWAAELRANGAFVGWFALSPVHDDPGPTPGGLVLGYRLLRRHWGRGLATEGTHALIDAAFAVHGTDRVYAETMAVNVRSRRVMERCGLRHVRTFHIDWDEPIPGAEHGDVEYALTREEWAARNT